MMFYVFHLSTKLEIINLRISIESKCDLNCILIKIAKMKMDLRGYLRILSMVFILFEFIVSDYSCPHFFDNKDDDLSTGRGVVSMHQIIGLMKNMYYISQVSAFLIYFVSS